MTSGSFGALVDALVALRPGTAAVEGPRHAIEGLLMDALRKGGRQAGERLVESLVAHGYALERLDALPCMWRVAIPQPRVLEIWFTGGDSPAVAALSYRVGKPWGGRAQKAAAKRQAEFYRRFERLAPDDPAMSPEDRLIQRVGEFEADVNNGGFGQYLGNKGEERAREALAYLSAIGAKRTAGWLESAMDADIGEDALERLDRQFPRQSNRSGRYAGAARTGRSRSNGGLRLADPLRERARPVRPRAGRDGSNQRSPKTNNELLALTATYCLPLTA